MPTNCITSASVAEDNDMPYAHGKKWMGLIYTGTGCLQPCQSSEAIHGKLESSTGVAAAWRDAAWKASSIHNFMNNMQPWKAKNIRVTPWIHLSYPFAI